MGAAGEILGEFLINVFGRGFMLAENGFSMMTTEACDVVEVNILMTGW